jgi:hypothetical protein
MAVLINRQVAKILRIRQNAFKSFQEYLSGVDSGWRLGGSIDLG